MSELVHANQEYQEAWKNKDETVNMAQLPYLNMIENKTIKEVENEVRIKVDQALRGKLYHYNNQNIITIMTLQFYHI